MAARDASAAAESAARPGEAVSIGPFGYDGLGKGEGASVGEGLISFDNEIVAM